MKKLLSVVISVTMALAAVCGGGVCGHGLPDAAVVSEAAEYNQSMLPYYYYGLTRDEQREYLIIRQAVIDMKSSVGVHIKKESVEKLMNMLYTADVLTCFNIKDAEWIYNFGSGYAEKILLEYNYSKKSYDTIIRKADEYSAKVMSGFTSSMSDYEKIKYIHDYIAGRCEYELEGTAVNNIYGALVRKKAKCDGYSHAFGYICEKAGICSVILCGKEVGSGPDEYHAWNKVYCNDRWYNVDVTWDDPIGNNRNNINYAYFMVSDREMRATHTELNLGFDVPDAYDGSLNYYVNNKLAVTDNTVLESMLVNEIVKAAKEGKCSVSFLFADGADISPMRNPKFISGALSKANKKKGVDIITSCWQVSSSPKESSIYTLTFFFPGTKLSDYYINIDEVDYEATKIFEKAGLKIE